MAKARVRDTGLLSFDISSQTLISARGDVIFRFNLFLSIQEFLGFVNSTFSLPFHTPRLLNTDENTRHRLKPYRVEFLSTVNFHITC